MVFQGHADENAASEAQRRTLLGYIEIYRA
jgi:hypothetical protein